MKSKLVTRRAAWLLAVGLAWVVCSAPAAQQGEAESEPAPEIPVKQIKMRAENWKWTPHVIRVELGTRLEIDVKSYDASHSFVLKDYGIKVALPEDSQKRIEFIADKPGEFKWKCGRPCGDGCAKMRGKLIVEQIDPE
jgi:heme/copper-type cytochrome/quinol oxidase subunit 2